MKKKDIKKNEEGEDGVIKKNMKMRRKNWSWNLMKRKKNQKKMLMMKLRGLLINIKNKKYRK